MSMMVSQSANSHSAKVQLLAHIDGRTHRLSHIGPNEIILAEPSAVNPGVIAVDIVIDDHCQTYRAEVASPLPIDTVRIPVTFTPFPTSTPECNP